MPNAFDIIVLGVGGIGSATLYHLAKQGIGVLGIDRFAPGHDHGSSHGQSRAIRKAYFEHPSYVPLLERAYENWYALEAVSGRKLLQRVGLLEIGPPQGALISGVRKSAAQYALPLEELTPDDVSNRFPGFVVPDGSQAVFEPDAGFLAVEDCVTTYVQLARQHGAVLAIGEAVTTWNSDGRSIEVLCGGRVYRSAGLIVTAGAWASQCLKDLNIPLRVLRKHLHWYPVRSATSYVPPDSPVFFYETPAGYYYGFPRLCPRGIKVAEHSGGEPVSEPLGLDPSVDVQERKRVAEFLQQHLPEAARPASDHAVCMYTMSPDEHFIVDRHPRFPNVCFAAGLSGHGFKFASVLGEVLSDLAVQGQSPQPIHFMRCTRFAD